MIRDTNGVYSEIHYREIRASVCCILESVTSFGRKFIILLIPDDSDE